MSHKVKYIGMDVHKEAIVIAVLNGSGKPSSLRRGRHIMLSLPVEAAC